MRTILVSGALLSACLLSLTGCGQKGELAHPTTPAPLGRATLLQAITPNLPASAPAATATEPTAAPPLPLPAK